MIIGYDKQERIIDRESNKFTNWLIYILVSLIFLCIFVIAQLTLFNYK